MTFAHWLYVLGVIAVVLTMILRRNVVIPCVIFTFFIGWVYLGSFIGGIQALFNSNIIAAQELFSVFYIIAVMVAMLKSISVTGADKILVKPLTKLMVSPLVSYIVLCISTIIISLFFWPTPAVPLIGALLVPAAISSGLPPMLGAMALALAGQGLALGGDIIIQGAPKLTAGAANIPVEMVTYRGGILTLITGIIAIFLAYFMNRKEIAEFKSTAEGTHLVEKILPAEQGDEEYEKPQYAKFLACLMVVSMVLVIISMFAFELRGGDASALLGGVALLIMMIASLTVYGSKGLDVMADFLADGLVFAFKVMGPIIPIAGFFFLGNPETVVNILNANAPGFLFDIGKTLSQLIPPTGILAGLGMMILGVITGLDGSGFSGLPLVGTLAGAMAAGQQSVAAGLGAIGQIGAIWSGGGTLVAWCSLVAVAGIVGVSVLDLVRKNFIPVVVGLIVSTIFGVLFLM
ncbi:MAG TPA: hypothetical protein GXZ31_00685 [Thermoanaerobacterales bacterium]|nr:hypothetical protein [Thermoanaerobacterales bacterium]